MTIASALPAGATARTSSGGGYDEHDAIGLAALVKARKASPAELLAEARARLAAVNGAVNAVIAQFEPEGATPDGPLGGVPFLVKDLNLPVRGQVTGDGSRFFDPAPAVADAPLVRRFRQAGLAIFGKTNTPEYGLNASTEPAKSGPTRNPWNRALTAGGSSGGSAAAVAAGIVPAAHATDGGGSIRVPASCCGVFGFKPTRARIPMWPQEHPAGVGMVHAISRSVRDSALLLDIGAGIVPASAYDAPPHDGSFLAEVGRKPGRLRIALMLEAPNGAPVDPVCVAAARDAAALCESLGHAVEEAAPDYDADAFGLAFQNVNCAGNAASLAELEAKLGRKAGADDIEPVTRAIVDYGRSLSATQFVDAVRTLRATGQRLAEFHARHDVLLTPTIAQPPVPIGTLSTLGDDIMAYSRAVFGFTPFTSLFNGTGQPAMSVPLFWSEAGLPIGVQFAAGFGRDGLLLRLAAQLERARPWAGRRPPLQA